MVHCTLKHVVLTMSHEPIEEPMVNFPLVQELQEYIITDNGTDYALLHLACAFAGICNSLEEAKVIASFAYRIMRQQEDMTDTNVLQFRR